MKTTFELLYVRDERSLVRFAKLFSHEMSQFPDHRELVERDNDSSSRRLRSCSWNVRVVSRSTMWRIQLIKLAPEQHAVERHDLLVPVDLDAISFATMFEEES